MRSSNDIKYFGIGANKTGTSSLRDVFKKANLKPVSLHRHGQQFTSQLWKKEYGSFLAYTQKFTSFQDAPFSYIRIPVLKLLQKKYPKAKFILTIRDSEEWFTSLLRWYTSWPGLKKYPTKGKNLKFTLGYCMAFDIPQDIPTIPSSLKKHKDIFIKGYEKRNEEIKTFFKDDANFLVIDVTQEKNRLEKLCFFMEVPNIEGVFPHTNKTQW